MKREKGKLKSRGKKENVKLDKTEAETLVGTKRKDTTRKECREGHKAERKKRKVVWQEGTMEEEMGDKKMNK